MYYTKNKLILVLNFYLYILAYYYIPSLLYYLSWNIYLLFNSLVSTEYGVERFIHIEVNTPDNYNN